MGAEAVLALMEATETSAPCVIAVDGNQIVRVPLKEAVQKVHLLSVHGILFFHLFSRHSWLTEVTRFLIDVCNMPYETDRKRNYVAKNITLRKFYFFIIFYVSDHCYVSKL